MEHYNDIIKNVLRNMLAGGGRPPQYAALRALLKQVDAAAVVTRVRDQVYKLALPFLYQGDITSIGGFGLGDQKQKTAQTEERLAPPYLPKLEESKAASTYTLILDLDETLVHYSECGNEGKFLVRPGTEEFLKEMARFYEIVIFTAATQDYADWVVDKIDPQHLIAHRLYRQHASVKDSNVRVVKV